MITKVKKANPLTLIYELYKVVNHKTDIKGFWKDDNGKIYIDNIDVQKFFVINFDYFKAVKRQLFYKGEKAVFYTTPKGTGILEDLEGNKAILEDRLESFETTLKPSLVRAIIDLFGGCTIFREDKGYKIVIYTEDKS